MINGQSQIYAISPKSTGFYNLHPPKKAKFCIYNEQKFTRSQLNRQSGSIFMNNFINYKYAVSPKIPLHSHSARLGNLKWGLNFTHTEHFPARLGGNLCRPGHSRVPCRSLYLREIF